MVLARDVHVIYAPWDSAPGWEVGMWLGGWYVAKPPVMGPVVSTVALCPVWRQAQLLTDAIGPTP